MLSVSAVRIAITLPTGDPRRPFTELRDVLVTVQHAPGEAIKLVVAQALEEHAAKLRAEHTAVTR